MAAPADAPPAISVSAALQRANVCTPHGTHASKCGYCKREAESSVSFACSFGVTCDRLDVCAYQALMNRGWRRSGTYFYKPDDTKSCCQHTPIRLDVHLCVMLRAQHPDRQCTALCRFRPSKDHLRLLRRFQAYLRGDLDLSSPAAAAPVPVPAPSRADRIEPVLSQLHDEICRAARAAVAALPHDLQTMLAPALDRVCADTRACVCSRVPKRLRNATMLHDDTGTLTVHANMTTDIVVRVVAAARAMSADGRPIDDAATHAFANAVVAGLASSKAELGARWHINMLIPEPVAPAAAASAAPSTKRSKMTDPPAAAAAAPATRPHSFRVEVHPAGFHEASYQLYVRYQMRVHGDDPAPTRDDYTRFLCSSPLVREPVHAPRATAPFAAGPRDAAKPADAAAWEAPSGAALKRTLMAAADAWTSVLRVGEPGAATAAAAPPVVAPREDLRAFEDVLCAAGDVHMREHGFGSFHHRYYLDDKLVCVCVNDHTPVCISSVYVFYDPDMRAFTWGKLSALREILWTAAMARTVASCHFVYLGFYIHTCVKMRYKAEYAPSDLLCPVTRRWVPFESVKAVLDAAKGKYVRLSPVEDEAGEAALVRARGEEEARVGLFMARACLCLSTLTPSNLAVLKDLNPRGRSIVMPLLRELASNMGADTAASVVTLLH